MDIGIYLEIRNYELEISLVSLVLCMSDYVTPLFGMWQVLLTSPEYGDKESARWVGCLGRILAKK